MKRKKNHNKFAIFPTLFHESDNIGTSIFHISHFNMQMMDFIVCALHSMRITRRRKILISINFAFNQNKHFIFEYLKAVLLRL